MEKKSEADSQVGGGGGEGGGGGGGGGLEETEGRLRYLQHFW